MDVLQRRVLRPGVQVAEHEVALAERAAGAVLSADADGCPFVGQGAEGERLRVGPVDFRDHRRRAPAAGQRSS